MTNRIHPTDKVLSLEALLERYPFPRPERLVFTNGCFDILHRGHVEYLHSARELGDALVVGLNSDDSVRRLKGPDRPLVQQEDRAVVLAALESVDAVCFFTEDTPAELIAALRPNVLAKGGDYKPDQIVGRESVEADGGMVVVIPFLEGRSTTGLVSRIQENRS